MAVGELFRYARRAFFSKPTPEKQLLRLAKQQPVRRVVEVGVESLESTIELLTTLVKQARGEAVAYTALDPFDERVAGADGLSLVSAYRQLVATGASVRLKPGGLGGLVAAEANSLADTDLLLLSREASDAALGTAWRYVPRMCHPGTLVLRRVDGDTDEQTGEWRTLSLQEISDRADQASPKRLAA